jgi:hypothetical protein
MPTPTYTPLATVTLGSSAASVTFSSIPATYRDLILVVDNAATGVDQQFGYRFNGDSGANYPWVYALGSSSGAGAASGSSDLQGRLGNINTTRSNHLLQIMDYSATDKHKTTLARSNDATRSQSWMFAGRWANTAAITSVRIAPVADFFSTGAVVSLYGIAA